MLTARPKTLPHLTIRDLRIDLDTLTIYYKLFYSKDNAEHCWVIPKNTRFDPPKGFEDGTDWAVWTTNISSTHTDYDWVYLVPMESYDNFRAKIVEKLDKKATRKGKSFGDLFE